MYAEYYGFRELPFNITPDPRFLYLNDCYQEALAALGYGIEGRKGFVSLIGEAGTGKTTLLRHGRAGWDRRRGALHRRRLVTVVAPRCLDEGGGHR